MRIIDELRPEYDLGELLSIAHMGRSTYYYTRKSMRRDNSNEEALRERIRFLYEKNTHGNETYGYRRICLLLRKDAAYSTINHKKVQKVMHEMGLSGYISRNGKRYSSYKGRIGKIADNLVQREFDAPKPNTIWSTDITEFKLVSCSNKKVYLSPIKDFCDGSIISYSCSSSPNLALVMGMLDKALEKNRCLAGLVFHSDQGWHYQHPAWTERLESRCIEQSMSRKGNCLDNSKMETFFSALKKAIWFGHEKEYRSEEELIRRIDEYIKWYNEERIQVKLKGLTPLQYRSKAFKITAHT